MATQAQIIANTTNAQHSTGPTTPEGKARSAANSTKLGFHAKHAVRFLLNFYQRIAHEEPTRCVARE